MSLARIYASYWEKPRKTSWGLNRSPLVYQFWENNLSATGEVERNGWLIVGLSPIVACGIWNYRWYVLGGDLSKISQPIFTWVSEKTTARSLALRTAMSKSATGNWTRHLPSATFEPRTTLPLVGPKKWILIFWYNSLHFLLIVILHVALFETNTLKNCIYEIEMPLLQFAVIGTNVSEFFYVVL